VTALSQRPAVFELGGGGTAEWLAVEAPAPPLETSLDDRPTPGTGNPAPPLGALEASASAGVPTARSKLDHTKTRATFGLNHETSITLPSARRRERLTAASDPAVAVIRGAVTASGRGTPP
jgi:hypothetical protein